MWQRKQTVFLVLAALACMATWLFPVRTFHWGGKDSVTFTTRGLLDDEGIAVVDATLPVPFHILFSVMAGVLLVAIFLYKNRPRQIRVVRSAWLIVLGLGVFQFVSGNSIRAYLEQGARVESRYGISFFIPLLVVALAVLAERGIKADEKLVRNMDRLR